MSGGYGTRPPPRVAVLLARCYKGKSISERY